MMLSKGQSMEDGTYIFTCGACNGTGKRAGALCNWCYDGDAKAISEAMKSGVRGQRYYGLLKSFLKVNGKSIVAEVWRLKALNGTVKVYDLGYIALKYGLNFKATVEWLEETRVIRPDIYDMFEASGLTVRHIYATARKEHEDELAEVK